MGILDSIPGLIESVMGDLLFEDGTMASKSGQSPDGRGGFKRSNVSVPVKALVEDYNDYIRATSGIPQNERKVLILGNSLSQTPKPEDIIIMGSQGWLVVEVSKDPANAVYTCRCRPTAVPSGINPVLIDAGASIVAQPGRPPIPALIQASSSVEAVAGTPVSLVKLSGAAQAVVDVGTPRVDVRINAGASAVAQSHGAVVDETGAGEPIGLLLALTKAPSPVVGVGEPLGLLLTLTKAA
ncbi:MAG: hypothetical protein AAFP81_00830 [Pseudomonadota bacterium]